MFLRHGDKIQLRHLAQAGDRGAHPPLSLLRLRTAGIRSQHHQRGLQAQGQLRQLEDGQGPLFVGHVQQPPDLLRPRQPLLLKHPAEQPIRHRLPVGAGLAVGVAQGGEGAFAFPQQEVIVVPQPFVRRCFAALYRPLIAAPQGAHGAAQLLGQAP